MEEDMLLLEKYPYVTNQELKRIHACSHYPSFHQSSFESAVYLLNLEKQRMVDDGGKFVLAGPIVELFSAHLQNCNVDQRNALSIHGTICVRFRDTNSGKMVVHKFYDHKFDDVEVLRSDGKLTLTRSSSSSIPIYDFMQFNSAKLVVDVSVGGENFIKELSCGGNMNSGFEQVQLENVRGDRGGVLHLRYITMPFAVYGNVVISLVRKDSCDRPFLNMKGKIVARYGNSYQRFEPEEFILFEKESEQVDVRNTLGYMRLTRCWIGMPAYSSLIVDLDLSEVSTNRKVFKETIEAKRELSPEHWFVIDEDFAICVRVTLLHPALQGICVQNEHDEEEGEDSSMEVQNEDDEEEGEDSSMELDDKSFESDDEMTPKESDKQRSDDEQIVESSVSQVPAITPRPMRPHQIKLYSSSAVEIFSVFIGGERWKDNLRVYGSIEVYDACTFNVFKREPNEAFELFKDNRFLPVLEGSRAYDDCSSLELKLDLKDSESRLCIRGSLSWDWRAVDIGSPLLNKQMCSVVQGEHGFAAIHYAIFPEAVQAKVGFVCSLKNSKSNVRLYGSLIAHYNNYPHDNNKDFYGIVLFKRNHGDSAQPELEADGLIPLERSVVVVPQHSSLVIEANLWDEFGKCLKCSKEFHIGANNKSMTMERNGYSLGVYVKWDSVSE